MKENVSENNLNNVPNPSNDLPKYKFWIIQYYALCKKNIILLSRRRVTILFLLLAPALVLCLLGILNVALRDTGTLHPGSEKPLEIPPCMVFDSFDGEYGWGSAIPDVRCSRIIYAPHSGEPFTVMKRFSELNDLSFGSSLYSDDVVGYSDYNALFNSIVEEPSSGLIAIYFNFSFNNYNYEIWYNKTITRHGFLNKYNYDSLNKYGISTLILTIQQKVDIAILNVKSNITDFNLNYDLRQFPQVEDTRGVGAVVSGFTIMFLFFASMSCFIIVVLILAYEKDNHMLMGMRCCGLNDVLYFLSWFTTLMLVNIISSLFCIFMGLAWDIFLISNCNFFVMFFLLFSYMQAMVTFSFLISSISPTSRAALIISFFILLVGFCVLLAFTIIGIYIMYNRELVPAYATHILDWFPPFSLSKSFYDIAELTTPTEKFNLQTGRMEEFAAGYKWADLSGGDYQADDYSIPSTGYTISTYYYCMLVFSFLAWYIGQVFPGSHGGSKPFYFLFNPYYWAPRTNQMFHYSQEEIENILSKISGDSDVIDQFRKVLSNQNSSEATIQDDSKSLIEAVLLSKDYGRYNPFQTTTHAVKSVALTLKENSILALLGRNGSGKTTLISMLIGMLSPTSGDCFINGHSTTSDIDSVRHLIGTCPQFDILWPELTAAEHLEFYCLLKGIYGDDMHVQIENCLNSIKLDAVKDHLIDTYSGGMKRRLSVGVAFMGSPKILVFDECTTGIDPMNRRYVKKMKKDKIVILTSHSLEEADYLGDVIAIMSKGEIVSYGTSLHLKNKYGSGYTLSLLTDTTKENAVHDIIRSVLPSAELIDKNAGSLKYGISISETKNIGNLFSFVENHPNILKNWSLQHSTLEEVFLRLVSESTSVPNNENQAGTNINIEEKYVEMSNMTTVNISDNISNNDTQNYPIELKTSIQQSNDDVFPETTNNGRSEGDIASNKGFLEKFQFRAIFNKSMTLYRRQRKSLLCSIICPILFLLLSLLFQDVLLRELEKSIDEMYAEAWDRANETCSTCRECCYYTDKWCHSECEIIDEGDTSILKFNFSNTVFMPSDSSSGYLNGSTFVADDKLVYYTLAFSSNEGVSKGGFISNGSCYHYDELKSYFVNSPYSFHFSPSNHSLLIPLPSFSYQLSLRDSACDTDIQNCISMCSFEANWKDCVADNCTEICDQCSYFISPSFSSFSFRNSASLKSNYDVDIDSWDRQMISRDSIGKYHVNQSDEMRSLTERMFPGASFVFSKFDYRPDTKLDIDCSIRAYLFEKDSRGGSFAYPFVGIYLDVSEEEKKFRAETDCHSLSCIYDKYVPHWYYRVSGASESFGYAPIGSQESKEQIDLKLYLSELTNFLSNSILHLFDETFSINTITRFMPYYFFQINVFDKDTIMAAIFRFL